MSALFLDFALWFPLLVGIGVGLVLTRAARDLAARAGLVDSPDGRRKTQKQPVPVAGGLAVLATTVFAVALTLAISPRLAHIFAVESPRVISLLAAGLCIVTVGLIDDRFNLRARYKLLGQIATAGILVAGGGFVIEKVSLFGLVVEFGPLAGVASVFWLLACMNSLNLIDGMDGLLGMVGLIGLLSLAAIALMTGQTCVAVIAFAMAGSVAGFLWFNLPPATIYMGDAGSMLIGLVIGSLAIPASLKGPATVMLLCPVAILILPMLDTSAAIVRRKLTGRGLAIADRGHFHHVLLRSGLTARRILLLVVVLSLVASGGALVSTAMNNDIYALVTAIGVGATLVFTRLFGHAEFDLVRRRMEFFLRGALRLDSRKTGSVLAVRLQGSADWEAVWSELAASAEQLHISSLSLDINSPFLHENYLARWIRNGEHASDEQSWKMEVPLYGQDAYVGRLVMVAAREKLSMINQLEILSKVVGRAEILVAEQVRQIRLYASTRETVSDSLTVHDLPALAPVGPVVSSEAMSA